MIARMLQTQKRRLSPPFVLLRMLADMAETQAASAVGMNA
ncbi:hypothetical protein PAMC26510_27195 [Caballeronia sordidicola]|uniref:Uncharacterized protein n=1 Tax=Caballeronia sordidicola TaxID=196367 RepID=A0A242MD97_CABSO|nr:hypothetical protein PAMC26510_27195 [Caballeronia sordidicola]